MGKNRNNDVAIPETMMEELNGFDEPKDKGAENNGEQKT